MTLKIFIKSILLFVSSASFANKSANDDIIFRDILKSNEPNYIVANATHAFSFDPMDGMHVSNASVFKLIYARPIEMNKKGIYYSFLLKNYVYNKDTNTLHFELNPDLSLLANVQRSFITRVKKSMRISH